MLTFTARNQNLLFALPYVGAIIGAAASPFIHNHFSRKWTLLIAYVLSIATTFLQLFAPNLGAFVVGRLGNLAAIAIVSVTITLYLSEIAPAKMRGLAITPINITGTFAGLTATIIINSTSKLLDSRSFKIPLAIQCALPVILIPLTLTLPESPLWLVAKRRDDEARKALRCVRKGPDELVDAELALLKAAYDGLQSLQAESKWYEIFNRENLGRTIFVSAFTSGATISGVLISTVYITVFMLQIGAADPFIITVVAMALNLAGTIVNPFIVDRIGRRPLALGGIVALLVIDVVAGGLAFSSSKGALTGIVAMSCIFNFVWALTYSPLSFVVPAEVAKPRLRNPTMAYTIMWSQLTLLIANFALPQLTAADAANLGAKTYLFFAGCMLIWLVLTYFFLPETRGRTFAEIEALFEAKVPARKWGQHSQFHLRNTNEKAKNAV